MSIRRLIAEGQELVGPSGWEELDVRDLLKRRDEATVAANAGAFAVPLGKPLRHPDVVGIKGINNAPDFEGVYKKRLKKIKNKK